MRNRFLLVVLLGNLALFGYSGVSAAAWGQEQPGPGGTDVSFDIEGDDFDVKVQRRQAEAAGAVAQGVGLVVLLIELAVVALILAAMWKVFTKAGKPGWAAIIPIYNLVVLLEICGRPIWWILLLLIPCVNFFVGLIVFIDLAKSFGKSEVFGIGLALLGFIFLPILGFGAARYIGPAAARGPSPTATV